MKKATLLLMQWAPVIAIAAGVVLIFMFAPHAGRLT